MWNDFIVCKYYCVPGVKNTWTKGRKNSPICSPTHSFCGVCPLKCGTVKPKNCQHVASSALMVIIWRAGDRQELHISPGRHGGIGKLRAFPGLCALCAAKVRWWLCGHCGVKEPFPVFRGFLLMPNIAAGKQSFPRSKCTYCILSKHDFDSIY